MTCAISPTLVTLRAFGAVISLADVLAAILTGRSDHPSARPLIREECVISANEILPVAVLMSLVPTFWPDARVGVGTAESTRVRVLKVGAIDFAKLAPLCPGSIMMQGPYHFVFPQMACELQYERAFSREYMHPGA